jgi:hypothetical protein
MPSGRTVRRAGRDRSVRDHRCTARPHQHAGRSLGGLSQRGSGPVLADLDRFRERFEREADVARRVLEVKLRGASPAAKGDRRSSGASAAGVARSPVEECNCGICETVTACRSSWPPRRC